MLRIKWLFLLKQISLKFHLLIILKVSVNLKLNFVVTHTLFLYISIYLVLKQLVIFDTFNQSNPDVMFSVIDLKIFQSLF